MYQFVRVTVPGAEQIFDDVKSAFEGKRPADKVFVIWNRLCFLVLRHE
jgi:hypothetical protein